MPWPDPETLPAVLSAEGYQWLSCAMRELEQSSDKFDSYLKLSAVARRKVGDGAFAKQLPHWTCADAARFFLLQKVLVKEDLVACVCEAYRYGDELEKAAILKGLYLHDEEGELVELAVSSCRTNSFLLFSAIAENNPYPALNYTDSAFNQMVLKALFLGFDVGCIVNLQRRKNVTLTTMCMDYLKERLAAGRSIPNSIWMAMELCELNTEDRGLYLQCLGDVGGR